MIRITLFVIAAFILVGWIGGQSIADCRAAGNSLDTCYAIMNP